MTALIRPVLVVDDDAVSRHVLAQTLSAIGLQVTAVTNADQALLWLEKDTPLAVLLDLVMPGRDGYDVLKHVRAHPHLSGVPVLVLSALDADEDIQRVFSEGADDYVHKPFRPTELIARLQGQLRLREYVEQLNRRERNAELIVELTQALASSLDIRALLFTVVTRLAELVHVDRCSIVLVGEDAKAGHVVASSDDDKLYDLPISLEQYPEIQSALKTSQVLIIPETKTHPLLHTITQENPDFAFRSIALIPLTHNSAPLGVLSLRAKTSVGFTADELALLQTLANTISIAISNARIMQSLRNETEQSATARVEAERRVHLLNRYADFFESAADGILVLHRDGSILFANPRAQELTGFAETELMGMPFEALAIPPERHRIKRIVRGFRTNIYPRELDIPTQAKNGQKLILNASFSSVLHEDDAILLSLRDVTQERHTAIELQQTKDFLERVIDSSVDAILSTDLAGRVLLFNRAATRILGYSPREALSRLTARQLFQPGEARKILRKLLDPEMGGWGRLSSYRTEVLSKHGEHIPVSLSAAFIMEGGQAVGSVGIFTDLRERLRMEQALIAAQEELRTREKQALIAELAGAAAHELNQPLTSIIGYAELVRRQSSTTTDHPLSHAATIILSEAERMAQVIKRIGKITRYETKNYVGEAKILDLEKASHTDSSPGDLP